MKLWNKPIVQSHLGSKVGGLGVINIDEPTKIFGSAIMFYASEKFAPAGIPSNSKRSISALSNVHIPVVMVLLATYISKIVKGAIGPVSINMVYLCHRPITCHVEPRKTVRQIKPAIDANMTVAIRPAGPRNFSVLPAKDSSFRVVMKKFAQTLGGKISFSHDALQMLIGQRPASVGSAGRASLF